MIGSKRRPGPSAATRGRAFRPKGQQLEPRTLLAIDLINIAGDVTPGVGPYGVLESSRVGNAGTGFSVAEVGDVNRDGFDDFLIGAPTIQGIGPGERLSNGPGATYLVFGSESVTAGTVNWLNTTVFGPNQRIGDLSQLGNTNQTNPVTGTPGFDYQGLTFVSPADSSGNLGASVSAAGDLNGDGFADFLIGAPGASDATTGTANTGKAYLVFGSQALFTRQGRTVDLTNPAANTDLNVITFVGDNLPNARIGRSVGGVGDVITDGIPDIAIGAPRSSLGAQTEQGAVFVLSGGNFQLPRTDVIRLETTGQPGSNVGGVIFVGASGGDSAGWSVAGAGNVNGDTTSAGQPIDDLLIGAPQFSFNGAVNGPGVAYLVNGGIGLANLAQTVNGLNVIQLGRIGVDVPGASFTGDNFGDETGYAVSTAGDFNADGLADFLIGSPGFANQAGRATLVYGAGGTTLSGATTVGTVINQISSAEFLGTSPGDRAGHAVTATGRINLQDQINEIALGSPGFNGGQGQAYIIPGNTGLLGSFSLAQVESSPLGGLIIGLSQPASNNFLGASLSGRVPLNQANQTIDADPVGDLIVGAPGLNLTGSGALAGGAFALQGFFLPIVPPSSNVLNVTIGVDQPFPPFIIDATQPDELLIYVFSIAGNPPFLPAQDIDPTTIVVNGIAFPNATIQQDPVDENRDGLPDAIISITPRSALGLSVATTTLVLTGRTLASSPFGVAPFQGSATIRVRTTDNTGGLPSQREVFGFNDLNAASPPYGERLLPEPSTLSRFTWRPLRVPLAQRQYLPNVFFGARLRQFFHPRKNGQFGRRYTIQQDHGSRGSTSRFPTGVWGQPIVHRGDFATIPPTYGDGKTPHVFPPRGNALRY